MTKLIFRSIAIVARTNFNLQLGYQVTEYFGVTRDTNYKTPNNGSLQGFYLNIGAGF